MTDGDRYLVISADCHAGASLDTYREYLEPVHRDEFDAWRTDFVNPFSDLMDTGSRDYLRNCDSGIRQADLEGDGIVGEVLFPNTVPPFYAGSPLFNAPDPTSARELELRWAGIHAHNRWLADFCAELPGRRAGVGQILLEDVDRALEEIRWISGQPGLFGGVLVPNPNADSKLAQLHSPAYEPIWALCEDLGVVVNTHGGPGGPNLGDFPTTMMMMFLEFGWYAQRPLVRLMFSGVFERHPRLTFVMTETGNSWVPGTLSELDSMYERVVRSKPGSVEEIFGGIVRDSMSLRPSEYWARQCYLGASFMSRSDCKARTRTGVERMMWGADYPHSEGTHPHTLASLRRAFEGVETGEARLILGINAARAYGFDLQALQPIADRIGPTVAEVATPLRREELPGDAVTMALAP